MTDTYEKGEAPDFPPHGTDLTADVSDIRVPSSVEAVKLLAARLHRKMDHLDPGEDDRAWEALTDHEQEFYRVLVEDLLGYRTLVLAVWGVSPADDGEVGRRA